MYKRIISMLLTALLLGCVPVTVGAEEVPVVLAEESAVEAIPAIEVIAETEAERTTETTSPTSETTESDEAEGIAIDENNFPDEVFRAYISYVGYWIDRDQDGILSKEEISACKSIDVSLWSAYEYIKSLQGIEYFTELTALDCSGQALTSLDLSSNTSLKTLNCERNNLTSLDVSSNTSLKTLNCERNNLTSLDVSKNTELTKLLCAYNELTSLDISNCTALTTLSVFENKLTSLDVSNNAALVDFTCTYNPLTSLDLSRNTSLKTLDCVGNKLTSLDVSSNTALTELYCNSNKLTSLDVSRNTALTKLACDSNQLTSLDVSNHAALTMLSCHDNKLTSLNLSNCTALTKADLGYNHRLTSLDVSSNTALINLDCEVNQLTSLDVSRNTSLKTLRCNNNDLTSLDVGNNTALTYLYCFHNRLTSLDVSRNTSLKTLNCKGNALTSLDVSNNTALTSLYCGSNQLTSLDISNNTALKYLYCGYNRLTSLDVSNNAALNDLQCPYSWYTIAIAAGKTFNLSSLPGNFDISKASNWIGGTVKGTILTVDANAKQVTYTYDCGNGKQSTFTLIIKRPIAPVLAITNNPSSGKPKLTWKAVDGAVKYQIYRSKTGKAGSFGLINTVKTLTTTNNNAVAGTKYYYKVRAVYSDNTKSDYSNVVTITCDLARPTGVKITSNATTGKNVISWNAVDGAARYQVYYSTTQNGTYKLLMTTKNLTHTHNGGVAGTKYFYKVKALYSSTTTTHAANSALTGYVSRVCDLAAPSGVKITAGANGKNQISWNAVSGAAKYQVWFSKTGKVNTFTCLMTTKNLNHTHKGGVAGQTYYYKVKAIHTNTNANSAFSAVVSRTSK